MCKESDDDQFHFDASKTSKINFDASVNQQDGLVGLGIIARVHSDQCVRWLSICLHQFLEPDSAEAKAAFLAAEFASKQGWRKIIIEGDSRVVISAITNKHDDHSSFGHIVSDIRSLSSCFDLLSLTNTLAGAVMEQHMKWLVYLYLYYL